MDEICLKTQHWMQRLRTYIFGPDKVTECVREISGQVGGDLLPGGPEEVHEEPE